MMEATPTLLSWSSGKDSAWALYLLQQARQCRVCGLLTTVNAVLDRIVLPGVRRELLEAQAVSAGLPLHIIRLPWPCPNEIYEAQMLGA